MAVEAPPSSTIDFAGNRTKTILKLALPTVVAMLGQSIVNEVDVVFFARLPCPADGVCEASVAQAALLRSLMLVWLFGGSLGAISVGAQALVARRVAERDKLAAGRVLANAAWFTVVGGVIVTAVSEALLPTLTRAMFDAPDVREVALAYSRWRLLGIVSMGTTMAVKSFFDGLGKTHVHLVASMVMNAANVLLCWLLIFGHAGFPRMGAPGAGLAGFVSTWLGLAIMLGYAWRERKAYEPLRWSNLSRRLTWDLLKLSVPAALATIVMMFGFQLFTKIVDKLDMPGAEPVNNATTTNIIAVLKLTFTACIAFGTATATLVGQSLGRRQPDEAERYGWASVRLGVVVFGVVGLLEGFVFRDPLIGFIAKSEAVRETMKLPMSMMGGATPLIAVALILSEALFGAGNTRFVAAAQFVLVFGILVPLSFVLALPAGFGLLGIWISACVYAVLAGTTMGLKFRAGSWKSIKL
jgi:putative MATE family efflux protein